MKTISKKALAIAKKRETETWIYSYGDLITNLLALFVMLLIIVTGSKQSKADFQKGLEDYVDRKNDKFAGSGQSPTDNLKQIVSDYLAKKGLASRVTLERTKVGIEMTFESALVFESGTATVNEDAALLIGDIADLLKSLPPPFTIDVEGHADSKPVTSGRFPSNWELSSARAGSVVRILEAAGISSQQMKAIGYGSTRPLTNQGEDDENRRVVIKVNSEADGGK